MKSIETGMRVYNSNYGWGIITRVYEAGEQHGPNTSCAVDFGDNGFARLFACDLIGEDRKPLAEKFIYPKRTRKSPAQKAEEENISVTKRMLEKLYGKRMYRKFKLALEISIERAQRAARKKGDFTANICDTVLRCGCGYISEKQMYCIARFMTRNNIEVEVEY